MMRFLLILLFLNTSIIYSQIDTATPASITALSTTIYKCLNGPVSITGIDSKVIRAYGDCYKKQGEVYFDKYSYNFLENYALPEADDEYVAYTPIQYNLDSTSVSFMLSNLSLKMGKGWGVLWRTEKSIENSEETLRLEYGCRRISPYMDYSYTTGIYMSYASSNAFFGISLTKLDKKGTIVWSKIFPRSIYGFGSQPELEGAPLMVQKKDYIYLFYADRASNYTCEKIIDIYFGGSFAAMTAKLDLVCLKISPKDGSFQKYLLSRKRDTKGMYYLYQTIDIGDDNFAVLGKAKGYHSYMFYKLSIK